MLKILTVAFLAACTVAANAQSLTDAEIVAAEGACAMHRFPTRGGVIAYETGWEKCVKIQELFAATAAGRAAREKAAKDAAALEIINRAR